MTPRERFRRTMRYGHPDRVPWFDEGMGDDVLDQWRGQGLPPDADPAEMFRFDRRERIGLDLTRRGGPNTIPQHRRDLASLRQSLNPDDPARLPDDWADRAESWRARDHLLELPIHRGLFLSMGVHDWPTLERVLYQLADEPALARQVMEIHGEFAAGLAERVLKDVQVDFASFSEPIGGNHGPLISPQTYRRIALDSYQPVLEVLQRHRVEAIVFVSWANCGVLLPDVLDAGFNCLWAMEADPAAMNYADLRRRFGRSLRLIGGIDLDAVAAGRAAIEREITTKVPPLLAQGGYVPLADGRVRANIPYADYVYYRRLLETVTQPG